MGPAIHFYIKGVSMEDRIKLGLLIISTVVILIAHFVLVTTSPQYAEFVTLMFWEVPTMVVERSLPGIGS